tara:strand:- start:60 stop:332 length:273 start_codon:yes stop_codon:yes gene_type:complete
MDIVKSYQIVANRYLGLLNSLGYSPCNMANTDYFHRSHLSWMLLQVRDDQGQSETKKHRWLGFVQGVLCQQGILSVEEERELTRCIFKGE